MKKIISLLMFSIMILASALGHAGNDRIQVYNKATGKTRILADGTTGQAVVTDGNGNISFDDVSGDFSNVDINGGTIDGTRIGSASATDATFSAVSLSASSTANQLVRSTGSGLPLGFTTATYPSGAAGGGSILRGSGGNWSQTNATYPDTATSGRVVVATGTNAIGQSGADFTYASAIVNATTVNLDGGTIDGTRIGSASASDATFNSVEFNNKTNYDDRIITIMPNTDGSSSEVVINNVKDDNKCLQAKHRR